MARRWLEFKFQLRRHNLPFVPVQAGEYFLANCHGPAASGERAGSQLCCKSFIIFRLLTVPFQPPQTGRNWAALAWPVPPNRSHACQHAHTSRRARMRTVRPLIAGAATTAAVLSVLGLTATAQALPAGPAARPHDPSVPKGIETAVNLPACPTGTTATSVTPAPPPTINVVIKGRTARLAGDWLSTGSTTFTVHCSDSSTKTSKITVTATAPLNSAIAVGSDTIQNVFDQFSADFNVGKAATATHLYSWDATNPNTGAIGDL